MIEYINTLKTMFSQLSIKEHNMEEKERVELHNMEKKERVELLLQCLPDSYDHLIIYVVNGVSRIMVIFNDVVAIVLKEEGRLKNKENRTSS